MESLLNSLTWTSFLPPFLSTLMASLTILILEHTRKADSERKGKLYAIACVLDIAYRELLSCLILNKRTVTPHIRAINLVLEGNTNILNQMFKINDVDVMKTPPSSSNFLPENYKALIGIDDVQLVAMHDTLKYLQELDDHRLELNIYVQKNLPNISYFNTMANEDKKASLMGYLDLLERIEHHHRRSAWFIIYVLAPHYLNYSKSWQFFFYRKKSISNSVNLIKDTLNKYQKEIPQKDYMQKTEMGGVQGIL